MFNEANRLCIAFHLGYAKLKNIQNNKIYFNNGIVLDNNELIVGKYKKLHLSFFSRLRKILGNPHYSPFRILGQKRTDLFK